jgi:predicted DNA-binding transcriptional regulator AlpA
MLRASEVADALQMSRQNFHAHLTRGNFPFTVVRIGRSLRFRENEVRAFLNGLVRS